MKTYGSVSYNKKKNRFDISTEPHVAIRLKRVFSKIDTWQYGTQSLSATPENCFDLLWFHERYPLVWTPEAEAKAKDSGDSYRDKVAVVDKLLAGLAELPKPDLKLPPRPYQLLPAQLLWNNGGLLLADDLGLGKTLSAIVTLTNPKCLPALVVTLSHLPAQWEAEIHRFSHLTTHILKKSTPYDFLKYTDGKFPDVIITNYHKLHGWAETFSSGIIRSLILDEGHEVRHRESQKYKATKHISLNVNYRMAASATPIFNYGGEVYNLMDVLAPDTLGTREEFNREWCTEIYGGKQKLKDPQAFSKYMTETGLMLRRTRKDVKRELPEITVVPHRIDADLKVLESLKGQAMELAQIILRQGGQDFKGQKMQAAGEFDLKMRQATGIAKAPYVAQFVRMLIETSNEPVLIGLWHREVYSILMDELEEFNPVMFSGTESTQQKEYSKQKFLSGESKVMLLSLRSGAGMDGLQHVCHTVVFAELDWAHAALQQFIGRVHRDGQDDPCTVYYLLADHGCDPVMESVLGIKRSQLEGIINPDGDVVEVVPDPSVMADRITAMAQAFITEHGGNSENNSNRVEEGIDAD